MGKDGLIFGWDWDHKIPAYRIQKNRIGKTDPVLFFRHNQL